MDNILIEYVISKEFYDWEIYKNLLDFSPFGFEMTFLFIIRKVGRVVEGACLEYMFPSFRDQGSNPWSSVFSLFNVLYCVQHNCINSEYKKMEDWPSGWRRTSRTRVFVKSESRVRIPNLPFFLFVKD